MIERAITPELVTLLGEYPVVTILGPRQAGKTTLARAGLEGFAYSNLESPEVRELARADPNAYLAQFAGQCVIDEIQHVPELLLSSRNPHAGTGHSRPAGGRNL